MSDSINALAPTTAQAPLPHLTCIEDYFPPDKWRECIDAMVGLVKDGSEGVKVRAFEALTKVLEISETARTNWLHKPATAGGTLTLCGDIHVNMAGGGDGVLDARATPHDELDEMVQEARSAANCDDGNGRAS